MFGQIALALVLGGVIGVEREIRNKAAGLRTHMMVAAGSCAFTLASIYGFGPRLGSEVADPSRVAAQIVSGIGFLGAGTVFRSGSEIRGLTTAATVWLVAALGMLVGAGLVWIGIFTTAAAWAVLHVLPRPTGSRRLRVGEPSLYQDEDDE